MELEVFIAAQSKSTPGCRKKISMALQYHYLIHFLTKRFKGHDMESGSRNVGLRIAGLFAKAVTSGLARLSMALS